MNRPPDDDLHALFDEARRADEEGAPPFRRVLEPQVARKFARPRWMGRPFAAAAAAVVVAILVRTFHRLPETPRPGVETWKPPTDFLLEASFTNSLDETPMLPEPVPDYSRLLEKEKGSKP